MNWEEANKFIEKLNNKNYCGYSDWRLPTIKELYSLIDETQHNPALPQGHPFTNIKSDWHWYWSSSTLAYNTDSVWIVSIHYGHVNSISKSSYLRVWPVRTGQCEAAGNSPRFIDNGDGTVTDKNTGLMWTKDANIQIAEDTV